MATGQRHRSVQPEDTSSESLRRNSRCSQSLPIMMNCSEKKTPFVGTQQDDTNRTTLASEDQVLRCLGAALIMQWNTLPAKLQRELFDDAGDMGELLDTSALRGQIARFLHSHKNDETTPPRQSFPGAGIPKRPGGPKRVCLGSPPTPQLNSPSRSPLGDVRVARLLGLTEPSARSERC